MSLITKDNLSLILKSLKKLLSFKADKTEVPTKISQLQNDSEYLTDYTETDPTVPAWAKNDTKPSYSKSEVGLGNVDNVKQYSASNPPPYPVTSVNDKTGAVSLDAAAVGARPASWMPSASDVGARPNTWMPTAEEVGARPDTWLPTISEIGAAPAGFGLGGSAKMLTSSDDLNNIKENGWYCWEWGNAPANAPSAAYGEAYYMNALRVWTANGNICCQEAIDVSDSSIRGMRIVRTIYGGQAFPWEWEIPPMTVGNEYRTTERWQKKAVYTKLINLGALPARNSNIHVSTDVSATAIIRATAQISDGSSMPYGYNREIISFSASTTTINVYTADNEYAVYSDKTGTAQIWYTKD